MCIRDRSLYVYKTSAEDYSKYVNACEEKGFTVEAEQSDLSYYAYNAVSYTHLDVYKRQGYARAPLQAAG